MHNMQHRRGRGAHNKAPKYAFERQIVTDMLEINQIDGRLDLYDIVL